jgi:hypothetical protein
MSITAKLNIAITRCSVGCFRCQELLVRELCGAFRLGHRALGLDWDSRDLGTDLIPSSFAVFPFPGVLGEVLVTLRDVAPAQLVEVALLAVEIGSRECRQAVAPRTRQLFEEHPVPGGITSLCGFRSFEFALECSGLLIVPLAIHLTLSGNALGPLLLLGSLSRLPFEGIGLRCAIRDLGPQCRGVCCDSF